MTASSMWDLNHAPRLGRLNKVKSGYYAGGWSAQVSQPGEWIQVKMLCNVGYLKTKPKKFKNAFLSPRRQLNLMGHKNGAIS